MSDKTIRLTVDLTYNPDTMHGDDEDSIEWFNSMLFGDDLQLVDFGDLGDMIGAVKVVADRIEYASDVYGIDANAEDQGADTLAYAHKSTCNIARTTLAAVSETHKLEVENQ